MEKKDETDIAWTGIQPFNCSIIPVETNELVEEPYQAQSMISRGSVSVPIVNPVPTVNPEPTLHPVTPVNPVPIVNPGPTVNPVTPVNPVPTVHPMPTVDPIAPVNQVPPVNINPNRRNIAVNFPVEDNFQFDFHELLLHALPVFVIIGSKILISNIWLFMIYNTCLQFSIHCDYYLVQEIASPTQTILSKLRLHLIIMTSFFVGLVFPKNANFPGSELRFQFYAALFFVQGEHMINHEGEFWSVGLTATIACLILKLVCVCGKAVVNLLPTTPKTPLSRQGKRRMLKIIELGCQLYCELVPIPLWWNYIRTGGETAVLKTLNLVTALIYINYKLIKTFKVRIPKFWASIETFSKNEFEANYGIAAPAETIGPDQNCLICLGLLHQPITTQCQHTFCTYCITRWIEDEAKQECPVCRRVIALEDPTWMKGESQLLIFAF